MRNIFSLLALIALSTAVHAGESESIEPETLITSCAAKLTADSLIQYKDEVGTEGRVTLGEIAMREVNRYQVLVLKKAPVVHPSLLEVKVSNDSPFVHDFEAPADYFPSAKIYGIDWKTTKQPHVQGVLKVTIHNPATGAYYFLSMQSGRIPVVRKTTTPKSPFDVRYNAAPGAGCAPWFDQNKNGSFYDMH